LILARTGKNRSSGTDPSGWHPPLTKHPKAPFRLSLNAIAKSFFGVSAACIVSKIFPPQCLQLTAQVLPVTEIVENRFGDER
jgi:hypothetical protein